jgi:hypothetical protein
LGVHNPFGSKLGKAQDPFIRPSVLNKLAINSNIDVRSAAINNIVGRIICDDAPKEFFVNSMLKTAQLSIDLTIQGIKCKGGTIVRFHENSILSEATLSDDQEIRGIKCKAGTIVGFHINNRLSGATLSEDQKIRGLKLLSGTMVRFEHCNGRFDYLKNFWSIVPPKDQEINGIKGLAGTRVYLFKDHLRNITLSEDQEIQGVQLLAGTEVSFDGEGVDHLNSAVLSKPHKVHGVQFNGKIRIYFKCVNDMLIKKTISRAYVIEEQEIQGEKYEADTKLDFDGSKFHKHVNPVAHS